LTPTAQQTGKQKYAAKKKASANLKKKTAKAAKANKKPGGGFVTIGDASVTKGKQRTCLPDAVSNCLHELGGSWDVKDVRASVMPEDGSDPKIGDALDNPLVASVLQFTHDPEICCTAPDRRSLHLLQHAGKCDDVVLIQANVVRTAAAKANGQVPKKERHCFVLSCNHRSANKKLKEKALTGALIDNRSAMPVAMLEPCDVASPEAAKAAIDNFFGGANVCIVHAWKVSLKCRVGAAKRASDGVNKTAKRAKLALSSD